MYKGDAWLNDSWLCDNFEILSLIMSGSCFLIDGGWLDWLLMYKGWSLGFR